MATIGSTTIGSGLAILTMQYAASTKKTTSSFAQGDAASKNTSTTISGIIAAASSARVIFTGSVSSAGVTATLSGPSDQLDADGVTGQSTGDQLVAQYTKLYLQDNEMSSQQISDALYSGQGIPGMDGNQTMQQDLDSEAQDIAFGNQQSDDMDAWVAAGRPDSQFSQTLADLSDDQVTALANQYRQNDAADAATLQSFSAAFANHTLVIQKATDVQALDYKETDLYTSEAAVSTESYNQAALQTDADGTHHALGGEGEVELYFSW
jgi:hypothetical protein